MGTLATRQQHSRDGLRYEADLTDAEWDRTAPARGSTARSTAEVADADDMERDLLSHAWRYRLETVAEGVPAEERGLRLFSQWRDGGLFERINHALLIADRERVGRAASLTAAVLDSQSVKTTESGGPSGYDAAKKIKGRKRHMLINTDGRALIMNVHRASVQNRDGVVPLLKAPRRFDRTSQARPD